nr:hypothetical protein [Tanacetum cinerariifolium]
FLHVISAGGNLFEVRSESEGFTVDEGKRTYSVRMWQLSRIPYVHATKSMYSTVLPPKLRKMPGRPRKKRIRSMGEGGSSNRVSKVGGQANCSNYKKPGQNKASCTEPIVEQTSKPKGVVGSPRNKQSVDDLEDVDVVQRSPVRDEGAGGSRGGARGSRGRGGVAGSRGYASGSRGGASVSRRVVVGSRGCFSVSGGASGSTSRGAGGFGSASGSRGRGASGSGGASGSRGRGDAGSKRKPVSTVETKKDKTQDEPQQTYHEPMQIQDKDQAEQTQEQAEIDLTQVEQTQEQTHDQVHLQEQPQQAALRMPSARIL